MIKATIGTSINIVFRHNPHQKTNKSTKNISATQKGKPKKKVRKMRSICFGFQNSIIITWISWSPFARRAAKQRGANGHVIY